MSRAAVFLGALLLSGLSALVGALAGGAGRVPVSAAPVPDLQGPSFASVIEQVNPAVVHITVVDDESAPGADEEEEIEEGEEDEEAPDLGRRRGEGTGFVVDPLGYILTNHHVVAAPRRIRVRLADKREFPATVVGTDPSTDLALLKVNAAGLPIVPLGDSDRLKVGEWVCAIGNPYRFDHSVTVGVVSSKGRKIYDASFDAYIQTDAAINPGNSGGPLINARGEAVGINSAVSVQGQGIGFAIPINTAREVLEQLRLRGRVTRGYLGVQLQDLEPELLKLVGARDTAGALVVDVLEGSGADAGLRRYDVIIAVSGVPVRDGDHLVRVISARPPGSSVALRVLRDGREMVLSARLGERQAAAKDDGEPSWAAEERGGDVLGLDVADLGREDRAHLRVGPDRTGVMVRQVLGLAAGSEALLPGDLVLEVNRRRTPDAAAYHAALKMLAPGQTAWLFVYRPRAESAFLAKLEVEQP
ncbi:MAG TPA: trypsin-like peptidase domain-containing protein [Vicinamibacteria bacterium]|jgi:serine protease Do